jgi:DNA-binding PucR family transcriptional regulator
MFEKMRYVYAVYQEGSFTKAAKKLFIHRTTMFYRLNKIQEIADIDHDNPEARLHLMLSFALRREEQNRKEETNP